MTTRVALNDPRKDFYQVLSDVLGCTRLETAAEKAYIIATIRHETQARWRPVSEYYPRFEPKGAEEHPEAFATRRQLEIYDYFDEKYGRKTTQGIKMGNISPGDGYNYRGRGFIQILGRDAYQRMARLVHIPLDNMPDEALNWPVAMQMCITGMLEGFYTGKKLADYLGRHRGLDFKNARKVVNGLNEADTVAKHALEYYNNLTNLERLVR